MEPERARDLLARERRRIEQALATHTGEPLESDDKWEPADQPEQGTDMYMDELDESRIKELHEELAAVERAEQRLRDGTYGLSVVSGQPIPDARLEARPTAETTVEEAQREGL
jgi:RNA polymerase-binding transcription factor